MPLSISWMLIFAESDDVKSAWLQIWGAPDVRMQSPLIQWNSLCANLPILFKYLDQKLSYNEIKFILFSLIWKSRHIFKFAPSTPLPVNGTVPKLLEPDCRVAVNAFTYRCSMPSSIHFACCGRWCQPYCTWMVWWSMRLRFILFKVKHLASRCSQWECI